MSSSTAGDVAGFLRYLPFVGIVALNYKGLEELL